MGRNLKYIVYIAIAYCVRSRCVPLHHRDSAAHNPILRVVMEQNLEGGFSVRVKS
jgi:hypothetical protein